MKDVQCCCWGVQVDVIVDLVIVGWVVGQYQCYLFFCVWFVCQFGLVLCQFGDEIYVFVVGEIVDYVVFVVFVVLGQVFEIDWLGDDVFVQFWQCYVYGQVVWFQVLWVVQLEWVVVQ